jgi:hypothetical protein
MTAPTTFRYSYSGRREEPDRSAADLFALAPLDDYGLGGDQVLARNARSGAEMTLPQEYFDVLRAYCSHFRTLDEHVEELMAGSDGDPQRAEAIRGVVQAVHAGGLTLSAQAVCRELAPVPGAKPLDERPIVAVITCDRPAALERLLNTLATNCDLGRLQGCVVVDDSRSADNAMRNRKVTGSHGLGYFGPAEAADLTGTLVGELLGREDAVRFLCDRERWHDYRSYGVARNFSLLLSAGRPLVVFDDDTLCESWALPSQREGIDFSDGQPEVVFYENHDAWRSDMQRLGHDPVAAHLRCLGLTVPEALSTLGQTRLDPEALRLATPGSVQRLHRGSRVLVTECGSLGDSGTGDNRWLATVPPISLERLLRQPGLLAQAQRQRRCWLGRERPTFSGSHNFSQVTGIDNRGLLPPYFPITRGEDQLFGRSIRYLYPDSAALEYAWAVPHLPIPERNWSATDNSFDPPNRFPGLLLFGLLERPSDCLATDPGRRLAHLAAATEDLAGGSDAALLRRFVDRQHAYRAALLRQLKQQLETAPEDASEWRHYLETAISQAQSSSPGSLRLDQLQGKGTPATGRAVLELWRGLFAGYGQALRAWPAMRDTAQDWVAKKLQG